MRTLSRRLSLWLALFAVLAPACTDDEAGTEPGPADERPRDEPGEPGEDAPGDTSGGETDGEGDPDDGGETPTPEEPGVSLLALSAEGAIWSVPFDPDQREYELTVPLLISSVSFVAEIGPGAVVSIDGVELAASGSVDVELPKGETTLVTVAARGADGSSVEYSLAVTRGVTAASYVKPSRLAEGLGFGFRLAADGDVLVVGAAGGAFVFERDALGAVREAQELVPELATTGFGAAVAVAGDYAFVGARTPGRVFAYRRTASEWESKQTLAPPELEDAQDFGLSVASNGDVLVVGAPGADRAFVYRRDADGFYELEDTLRPGGSGSVSFGGAVAISPGGRIAVGALYDDSDVRGTNGKPTGKGARSSGAVYVFDRREDGLWGRTWFVKASNADASDGFGYDVAIDDRHLVVGAWSEGSGGADPDDNSVGGAGAAYVFEHTFDWIRETGYLKSPTPREFEAFGKAVAVEGGVIAVGTDSDSTFGVGIDPPENDGYAPGTGAVVLFYLVDGAWTRGELIKASNAEDYDRFGKSVALSRSRVFVGAMTESGGSTGVGGDQSNNDVPRSGAVYLY